MSEPGIEQRLRAYRGLFDLTGRNALVLGAASGIGKSSAEALAALGAAVTCADIDRPGVESTAADIGAKRMWSTPASRTTSPRWRRPSRSRGAASISR
jgi:NAD(P)-dependent dehydrogenase (short-subunit alcohol dehydrogenase family)